MKSAFLKYSDLKRKFSIAELFDAYIFVPGAIPHLIRNRRKNVLDPKFIERLMLAVTEVNGCAACSYAHARMALNQGMSTEEISSFLNGDGQFVEQTEAKAILFAQHFAECKGHPEEKAFQALQDEYGANRAPIILSACQIMHAANVYGIPYSALHMRLKGRPYGSSNLWYELLMLFGGAVAILTALLYGLLRGILGVPNIRLQR